MRLNDCNRPVKFIKPCGCIGSFDRMIYINHQACFTLGIHHRKSISLTIQLTTPLTPIIYIAHSHSLDRSSCTTSTLYRTLSHAKAYESIFCFSTCRTFASSKGSNDTNRTIINLTPHHSTGVLHIKTQ